MLFPGAAACLFTIFANDAMVVTSLRHSPTNTVTVLVHGQVTNIFVVSVGLSVCAEFFLAGFDPILIKLGHMLYVWV